MKLEDQICTYEQAKKLHELGIKDDNSLVQWHETELGNTPFFRIQSNLRNQYSAFTVAELGIMLPPGYDTMRSLSEQAMMEGYIWRGYGIEGEDFPAKDEFLTEAQCRAEMLIQLIEAGKIKSNWVNEEINNRLNS